jgi:c(7)-type cytochrome triheme protein
MPKKVSVFVLIIIASAVFAPRAAFSRGDLPLPPLWSPEVYGDVFINRTSPSSGMTPVIFSHWVHRPKFTCRVCHFELDFSMKTNDTPIVCDNGKMQGRFCATCHNGKDSFGPSGPEGKNCDKCHNASSPPNREKFFKLQAKLPRSAFGNEIDWTKALNDKLITPKWTLSSDPKEQPINIDKTLTLEAEMSGISSAVFPHNVHEKWLDCAICHPDIFNIKKKTSANLTMADMIKGETCGICHLKIAFPLNDCKRCHPKMRM